MISIPLLWGLVLSEAYVSFLGLGVRQPTATWGNMLEETPRYLAQTPWLWCFPGGLILLTVLAINGVGDGLRDAVDPRTPGGSQLWRPSASRPGVRQ